MAVNGLTMNKRSLDKLPEDVRNIIVEVGRGYESESGPALNKRQQVGLDGLAKVGAVIKELPDEARAGWAESLAGFAKEQAAEADKRGMPGTDVMRSYLDVVSQSGFEWLVEYTVD